MKAALLATSPRYVDPARPIPLPLTAASSPESIDDSGLEVRRSILPGGVRLITQQIPGALSASLGLWVAAGSRDERPGEGGISHFLEHLLFKGTQRRTALEIAESFDARGAESNAATRKESTCYWSHMVADDLPDLLPVLVDMVTDSTITDEDVEVERGVILDELAMSEDTPPEVAGEAFARAVFGDEELGRPIGGTKESVQAMTPGKIRELYHRAYTGSDLVVSVAGAVDHDEVASRVLDALNRSPWKSQLTSDRAAARRSARESQVGDPTHPRHLRLTRSIEQSQIIVGGPWLRLLDPAGPASSVALAILGGGMSSRLFQEIREKRGLAYSTYAFGGAYADTGNFAMYAGCAPDKVDEVQKVMWGEVEKLAEAGPTTAELRRAKGQIRGGVTLNLEDTASRMSRLAHAEMVGELVPLAESLARIDAVQEEDVREMAEKMVSVDRASAIVGPDDH